jgi:hypothetical protein
MAWMMLRTLSPMTVVGAGAAGAYRGQDGVRAVDGRGDGGGFAIHRAILEWVRSAMAALGETADDAPRDLDRSGR